MLGWHSACGGEMSDGKRRVNGKVRNRVGAEGDDRRDEAQELVDVTQEVLLQNRTRGKTKIKLN